MRVTGEPAYVLHHRPYSETSLLAEVYTRHYGRLGLIAKGARRPCSPARGLLAPFQPTLISFSGKGELAVATGVEPNGLAHDLTGERLYGGFYLNELLMRLTVRHDAHERLFDLYHATLARLAADADISPALRIFEKHLLSELGYGLLLDHDVTGKSPIVPEAQYEYVPETGPVLREPLNQPPGPGYLRNQAIIGERLGAIPRTGGRLDQTFLGQEADQSRDADPRDTIRVSGAALLALASEDFADPEHLRAARAILRACLARHLGDRPLESRRLIRAARMRVPVPVPQESES